MWTPKTDGIDHINVYSKGKTELGRLLSNFAHTPFYLDPEGAFASVEAYWYWKMTGMYGLRALHGWEAKNSGKIYVQEFRESGKPLQPVTVDDLRRVYWAKLTFHPYIREELLKSKLPLAHYYVLPNDKIIVPKEFQWTAALWEEFREELEVLP